MRPSVIFLAGLLPTIGSASPIAQNEWTGFEEIGSLHSKTEADLMASRFNKELFIESLLSDASTHDFNNAQDSRGESGSSGLTNTKRPTLPSRPNCGFKLARCCTDVNWNSNCVVCALCIDLSASSGLI